MITGIGRWRSRVGGAGDGAKGKNQPGQAESRIRRQGSDAQRGRHGRSKSHEAAPRQPQPTAANQLGRGAASDATTVTPSGPTSADGTETESGASVSWGRKGTARRSFSPERISYERIGSAPARAVFHST